MVSGIATEYHGGFFIPARSHAGMEHKC